MQKQTLAREHFMLTELAYFHANTKISTLTLTFFPCSLLMQKIAH